MPDSIFCIAQINGWRSAFVLEAYIFRMPSIQRGSKRIPLGVMILPHHRIQVAKRVHFSGWSLKLHSLQARRKQPTEDRWFSAVPAWIRISFNHHTILARKSSGRIKARVPCRYMTALVVLCRTRVGVYIQWGMRNDWHSWKDVFSGSCQYHARDQTKCKILILLCLLASVTYLALRTGVWPWSG